MRRKILGQFGGGGDRRLADVMQPAERLPADLPILEALACGTPAVGTPIGATPEILGRLAPQLLLAGTAPHAIRRGITAMLEWFSDSDAVGRLRAQCRTYVETHYGWDHAVDELEATMDELLTDGGRHG